MAYAAGDIPEVADVLIDGEVYMLYESPEIRGRSEYTPLFVPRENIQGDYGDTQFDFWMTLSQNDWSLGQHQRFIRVNDAESRRQFWQADNVNITVPGEVTLSRSSIDSTVSTAIDAVDSAADVIYATGGTNMFEWTTGVTETVRSSSGITTSDRGLHDDATGDTYLCTSAGSGSIRRFNGSAFEQYSAQEADVMAFLNNVLYAYDDSTGTLYSIGSDGPTTATATQIHQFVGADGDARNTPAQMRAFGSKLILLLSNDDSVGGGDDTPPNAYGGELWEYDGVGVTKIADFPANFKPFDFSVARGSVFVSGFHTRAGATRKTKQSIYVVAGGQVFLLWEEFERPFASQVRSGIVEWDEKIWWVREDPDLDKPQLMSYNPVTGAFSAEVATHNNGFQDYLLATNPNHIGVFKSGDTNFTFWPSDTVAAASSGFVKTSLFDGDSTLQKHWESVQVEFDDASDGDGGSVDIDRAFDSLADGDFTSVQTGATSGTEYGIHASSRSISIKITLNKGTSTHGPVLKAVRVRGTPINPSFRKERYVLNLGGVDGENHVQLRNNQVHPKDGLAQATDLRTAFTSADDFSVTDEFGTYNAVFEPNGLRLERVRSQEYIAVVELRES